ncbi:DgyrCDS808 [Dimorphilus gyrociliatus]|uniref:DgyrCDS808 n=1 Tax=Dimorphilus gyrociliatus TaxID=2664684 RepID=A0A7I8V5M0_9ANNE|nr:DgyrCDS808 [Dimorphilus gyrociliatus]
MNIFWICALFSICNGYSEFYLNINTLEATPSRRYPIAISSAHPWHFTYDKTIRTYQTSDQHYNISDIVVHFYARIMHDIVFERIRILKIRNETEVLKFNVYHFNKIYDYEFYYIYKQGWNELYLNNSQPTRYISIRLNTTTYHNLEIGEFQMFTRINVFSSCFEWSKNTNGHVNQGIYVYDMFDSYYEDVARTELGATCTSSGGSCIAAIKDTVLYVDEMWQPTISSKEIFIKIIFFQSNTINEIRIKQPMENEIDTIRITNDESLIQVKVNKTSEYTIISTNIETGWLKFIFNKDEGKFIGIYEINAFAYLPKYKYVYCSYHPKHVRSYDYMPYGNRFIGYRPTTTTFCSRSFKYFNPRYYYISYKNTIQFNAFVCYQSVSIQCREHFSDNFKASIHFNQNTNVTLFEENIPCFSEQVYCTCNRRVNDTFRGTLNHYTKNFPIEEVCSQKNHTDPALPLVNIAVNNLECFSYTDYLHSANDVLVDGDLNSCSSNLDQIDRITLKEVIRTSMRVRIWLKRYQSQIDCNDLIVHKHDQETCGSNAFTECEMTDHMVSLSTRYEVCTYICKIGSIDELLINKRSSTWPDDIHICEISTLLLDTTYNEHKKDV